ncbi:MAG: hypothetical protein ACD_75C00546G0001 [uncultured bacterium]|nr:MAG: hypothetical protein ACD_75C00546G0001 [uncultured bacterium]
MTMAKITVSIRAPISSGHDFILMRLVSSSADSTSVTWRKPKAKRIRPLVRCQRKRRTTPKISSNKLPLTPSSIWTKSDIAATSPANCPPRSRVLS